jgi:hypothetical protein
MGSAIEAADAQLLQNLAPSRFSVPHFGQIIRNPDLGIDAEQPKYSARLRIIFSCIESPLSVSISPPAIEDSPLFWLRLVNDRFQGLGLTRQANWERPLSTPPGSSPRLP